MGRELNIEKPGRNTFQFNWFLGRFSPVFGRKITKNQLVSFLECAQKVKRIFFKITSSEIELYCPKLKDLADEYTQKIIRSKQGKKPDNIRTTSGQNPVQEGEEEVEKENIKEIITKIIVYLNEKTGRRFSPKNKETIRLISGRLNDPDNPADEKEMKKVIEIKSGEWLKDKKMSAYLNPHTLFRPSNFERYRNQEKPEKGGAENWNPSEGIDQEEI